MRCPKCGYGPLYEQSDRHGSYISCLVCGYVKEATPPLDAEGERVTRGGGFRKRKASHGGQKL